MLYKGDLVINKNDLRLDKTEFGRKYAMTLDVYKINNMDCDGYNQIEMIDINTNKTCYCSNPDYLVKVNGGIVNG